MNLPLRPPELYDLLADPDESYNVAAEHPRVVTDIQSRVDRLMAGFPEPIRTTYADTRAARPVHPPSGALPRVQP